MPVWVPVLVFAISTRNKSYRLYPDTQCCTAGTTFHLERWCHLEDSTSLSGVERTELVEQSFTSLHFIKARAGQRTPAALSDSYTGPYIEVEQPWLQKLHTVAMLQPVQCRDGRRA